MNARNSRSGPQRGFALVITVILLALLLLVLVSTATLTHIETSIGFNSRREAQAKQNALFALNRAIGELQRHAGPDQRITATADIMGSGLADGRRFWTGVWDSSGGTERTWLISGNEDLGPGTIAFPENSTVSGMSTSMTATSPVTIAPPLGTAQPAALLVGRNTAGYIVGAEARYVVAPLIDLNAPAPGVSGTPVTGRYAWWVGDEGVKASITETERHGGVDFFDTTTGDDYTDTGNDNYGIRDRIAQLAQPRQRIDAWSASEFGSINPTTSAAQLNKVLAPAQISFVTNGPPLPQQRGKFHDFSVWSRGVLADPSAGGLKFDLSNPVDAVDPRLRAFLDLRPEATSSNALRVTRYVVQPTAPGPVPADLYWVAPVVSEFRVVFQFQPVSGSSIPVIWQWEVELWNPYNSELVLRELHLHFENPGTLSIQNSPSPPVTIDWWATIAGGAPASTSLVLEPSGASQPLAANFPRTTLSPGEVLIVKGGVGGLGGTSLARTSTDPTVPVSASAGYVLQFVPSPTIKVVLTDADDSRPISAYFPPPSAVLSSTTAAIQFRLNDGTDDPNWLWNYDPRAPEVRNPSSPSPYAANRLTGLVSSSDAIATSPTSAPHLITGTRMPPFDLPRQQLISIGALQHFCAGPGTGNLPSFNLGHPWAGSGNGGLENGLFDRAFFSTIPRVEVGWNLAMPLPNTRIEVYNPDPTNPATEPTLVALGADTTSDQKPASRLMVKGAFNLNSTSVDAWRALTRGTTIASWPYWFGVLDPILLSGAFFHHSQTGQDLGYYFRGPPPNDPMISSGAWTQGVRDLTTTESDALASYLALHVRDAGEPFRSVADFVNSGILQAAINSVPSINETPGLDYLAPGYLTQADILTAWAPFLQARSDTFLIRTYGEAVNPVTGNTEARAWCEAVVQRVPDYVDASEPAWTTPPANPDNVTFGRRFKIVQFRWLSPSDI